MPLPNSPSRPLSRKECLENAKTILGYPEQLQRTQTSKKVFTLAEFSQYNHSCAELAQAWIALADRME